MKLRIEFPEDGKLRSRQVVSRSNSRVTGKHPSWKMQRMIQYESKHELNCATMLDACPAVISFNEQPCIVHYEMDGASCRHYPDFLVQLKSGLELWEVKERSDAMSPDVMQRTSILMTHLPRLGYTYRVILAENLAIEPRLGNAKQLLRFGNSQIPPVITEQFRGMFQKHNHLPWGALVSGVPDGLHHGSRLVLEGYLEINMNIPLTGNSLVAWSESDKELQLWPSLLM